MAAGLLRSADAPHAPPSHPQGLAEVPYLVLQSLVMVNITYWCAWLIAGGAIAWQGRL